MKTLKWIIFIPIAVLAHFIGVILMFYILIILGHLFNIVDIITFTPEKYANPLDPNKPFLIDLLSNISGVIIYFFVGNLIISIKGITNKQYKISNYTLFTVFLLILIFSGYSLYIYSNYSSLLIVFLKIIASIFIVKSIYKFSDKNLELNANEILLENKINLPSNYECSEIHIEPGEQIYDFSFIKNYKSLQKLSIFLGCLPKNKFGKYDPTGIENLSNIKYINFYNSYLKYYDISTGQSDYISVNNDIIDLNILRYSNKLEILELDGAEKLRDISTLTNCINLKEVILTNSKITSLNNLKGIENIYGIEKLNISNNPINDISILRNFYNLKNLDLSNCSISNLSDIKGIELAKDLKYINLSNNKLTNISILKMLNKLIKVNLYNCKIDNLCELNGIMAIINVEDLDLTNNKIEDIVFLENFINLKHLKLSDCKNINKLDFKNLSLLKSLNFQGINFKNFEELIGFGYLSNLEEIVLVRNHQLNDISFLSNLKSLKKIQFHSMSPYLNITDLSNLKQKNPNLNIILNSTVI